MKIDVSRRVLYSLTYTHIVYISAISLHYKSIYYLSISDANAMNLYNNRETEFAFTERQVAFVPSEFHRSGFRESVIWLPIIVINRAKQFTALNVYDDSKLCAIACTTCNLILPTSCLSRLSRINNRYFIASSIELKNIRCVNATCAEVQLPQRRRNYRAGLIWLL